MSNNKFDKMTPAQFTNELFGIIRVLKGDDGEIWFIAKDVATALGYSNPPKAVGDHCRRAEKMTITKRDGQRGGAQFLTIIPEADVYRLIIRSKLPTAEQFEEWVFEEVLPSIRKHGAYMTPEVIEQVLLNPDTVIHLAKNLKLEQERNRALESENKYLTPKAIFNDLQTDNGKRYLFNDAYKGFEVSSTDLRMTLLKRGVFRKDIFPNPSMKDGVQTRYVPREQFIEEGYFMWRTFKKGGVNRAAYYITPKGMWLICQLLLSEGLIEEEPAWLVEEAA
ncbi:BRO family, N-terminal domain [Paucidesulfovibrio gracilis DSM 16080]|uniref:BRO family, N-terminal domain n=1 Tax=Paucidesulfovibrio gracilis DSM 16080 TaxID=1121449 RepID=A0A1T4WMU8_9BACT|nr:BRO family protein [Paucidesulfovibrio gracilis]SKA78218.1 BRO family, N-terminal domain [Paucidesulfovibrio gracilis DSM 16080]